jgi:hypothetical protein
MDAMRDHEAGLAILARDVAEVRRQMREVMSSS